MVRIQEDRRTPLIAEALDDRHQLLHADEAPFGLRRPYDDREPSLARSLNDAVQGDQIRHIEMTNRELASVSLLQNFE
jgi:hypothetical protein